VFLVSVHIITVYTSYNYTLKYCKKSKAFLVPQKLPSHFITFRHLYFTWSKELIMGPHRARTVLIK
jgi:hypothetical protein